MPDFKDWVMIIGGTLAWVFGLGVIYQRFIGKLNGLGGRVGELERKSAEYDGILRTQQGLLTDAARLQQDTSSRLGRVEHSIDSTEISVKNVERQVLEGFAAMRELLLENGAKIRERIVRIETVQEIEKKIGKPIGDE